MVNVLLLLLWALLFTAMPSPALADGGGGGDGAKLDVRAPQKSVDPAIKDRDYAGAIKSGDPTKSIPIYQKALSINPEHRGAHEYIGEAYLQLNDAAKAREHLARLDKLCFFSCEEYRDLKKAVEAYEKRNGRKP